MGILRYITEQILYGFLLLFAGICFAATQQHLATGLVLKVDRAHHSLIISCQEIPGFMHAMIMPIRVRDTKELSGLAPGTTIEFEMSFQANTGYGENIQIRRYQSLEQDPLTASRLRFLNQLTTNSAAKPLLRGEEVPNFTLIDQNRQRISLSEFIGKVVGINFIYTSCALPQYCYRSTNNFGMLQHRFRDRLGRELILLTVTFDPARDQPDVLAQYASRWKADTSSWHFLTGTGPEIQRVTAIFGVDFFPSEGFMDHSLHTAIIDRRGKLVANIEGNQFTAEQLQDLVESVLDE
jgi:protein SCO1